MIDCAWLTDCGQDARLGSGSCSTRVSNCDMPRSFFWRREMKSIRTFPRALALAVLVGFATAPSAQAAVVSVLPSPVPDKTVGDTFSVDIVISELTEPVGGFSFFLDFDDSVISSTGYVLDPGSLMDPAIDQSVFTVGVSPLEPYFFSDLGA